MCTCDVPWNVSALFLSILHLLSIGYPVVTLGFGFKSYVSYKMRLRKQKEVQKENEFYMQLLQQALPPEQQMLQRQEREAEEGTCHTGSCSLMNGCLRKTCHTKPPRWLKMTLRCAVPLI